MSYIIPSVLVYQQLENSGGVANTTPDLESCIIGPAYQVLTYVAGSTTALIKTAATSTATATAAITAGSDQLVFDNVPVFTTGDILLITGAASGGTNLQATVESALGNVLTLSTVAGTTVTAGAVHKQGAIANPLISNTFNLPSQVVGQLVDTSSIEVYANQAYVETVVTGFTGYVQNNELTISVASGTADTTATSAVIENVTNPTKYVEGEYVTLSASGPFGADLTAKILVISGDTFTLDTVCSSTGTGTAMVKAALSNVDSSTSTLRIEAGDSVLVQYTDTDSVAQSIATTVVEVVSATGTITNLTIADMILPGAEVATTSTATMTAAATGFTLTSATGFATGDTILIVGAGADGSDLEATIGTLTGAVISGLSPAVVTTVTGSTVVRKRAKFTVRTRKLFNNQLVPITKPILGGANYVTTNTAVDGTITINASPEISYGKLISGTIHIAYRALRTDLSGSIMTINDQNDNLGQFGVVNELNPLALGCQICLANTTTRTRAIAVSSNDQAGYLAALDLAESERVYGLVPLTQDLSICQAFSLHAQAMSTPEEAMWRAAYVNTAIPTRVSVGSYTADIVNANSGDNTITLSAGKYILTASNATFISDNVVPGDTINVTSGSGSPSPVGTMEVLTVVSNQQLVVDAAGVATAVSYYVDRTLTKTQRAAAVAATSTTFGSNRVVHVQPDTVVINVGGRRVVQPGYFLACAIAGLVAGFPSQQGFTNIGIAGISDISNSNFTFTRAQLNTMAAAGTCLFVQETAGGIPYIRHELTTDMSVYEYRELQAVKNWDFLSYFFHDILKPFIGKWNITSDTLGTIRQTIVSGAELLKAKKLPRIGAPLLDYKIETLEQNATSKDRVTARILTIQPSVLNYLDVYLVI